VSLLRYSIFLLLVQDPEDEVAALPRGLRSKEADTPYQGASMEVEDMEGPLFSGVAPGGGDQPGPFAHE
jgi:hypothetical protein